MRKKLFIIALIFVIVSILTVSSTLAAEATFNGTFTGDYRERFDNVVCDPNTTPVTISGSVEATITDGAIMIGLIDKGFHDSDPTATWGSGAYAYFGLIGSNLRIGPSDGFYYGELNQVGANVPYTGGPQLVNFVAEIYAGQIKVTYNGANYVDTYGDIEDANTYDAYSGAEFDSGAYVGIDIFDLSTVANYSFTVSGCTPTDDEGPVTSSVVATPNPIAVGASMDLAANVDDSTTGGSIIDSAEYSLDDGAWTPMDAADGDFDEVNEDVQATFAAPAEASIYDLCVRGTDVAGNTGAAECTMLVVYDPDGGFVTGGGWIDSPGAQSQTVFSTIPEAFPGSFPSLGAEAYSMDELGDHIVFAGTERKLDSVLVSMTNWACENDFIYDGATWVPSRDGYSGEACLTTPGSGFMHPITLNIYEVDNSGVDPEVGALIASANDTYFIPFRPSWDSVNCTADGQTPATDIPFGGTWYDPVLDACVHGFAFTIEFDFAASNLTLPNEVVYGVEYNSAHHGNNPIGVNGPYNSLNVSLTTDPASPGTVSPDLFVDSTWTDMYCDNGTGGMDTFRNAGDCWGDYSTVATFNMLTEGAYKPDPTLTDRANFGFVSKYKKGADTPTGNTEFQFQAGGLNFNSTSYDWLVVTGSDYAKFKGEGTINGEGSYKFQLWAGDGDPDTFRIKIWYEENGSEIVVYDNGMDQAIGGGNIVVHSSK